MVSVQGAGGKLDVVAVEVEPRILMDRSTIKGGSSTSSGVGGLGLVVELAGANIELVVVLRGVVGVDLSASCQQ